MIKDKFKQLYFDYCGHKKYPYNVGNTIYVADIIDAQLRWLIFNVENNTVSLDQFNAVANQLRILAIEMYRMDEFDDDILESVEKYLSICEDEINQNYEK